MHQIWLLRPRKAETAGCPEIGAVPSVTPSTGSRITWQNEMNHFFTGLQNEVCALGL